MKTALLITQIFISTLITIAILLQSQGTGLGSTWGGGGETYHTRRGVEKVVYYLTMVLIVIFVIVAFAVLKVG